MGPSNKLHCELRRESSDAKTKAAGRASAGRSNPFVNVILE
jgi:hypothetical protein